MRKASLLKIILSLLLSAIMIVGFVACGGADAVTGSASQTTPTTPDNGGGGNGSEDLGDNNGDSGNTWNVDETKGQTFAQDTYIDIYVAGLVESDEPFNYKVYKVSYEVPIV